MYHSIQGLSLALPLGYLPVYPCRMILLFHIERTNLIFLFQIRRLVLCHPRILTNQRFKAFCQNAKFLLYSFTLLDQFPRPANTVNQGTEFHNHLRFDLHQVTITRLISSSVRCLRPEVIA